MAQYGSSDFRCLAGRHPRARPCASVAEEAPKKSDKNAALRQSRVHASPFPLTCRDRSDTLIRGRARTGCIVLIRTLSGGLGMIKSELVLRLAQRYPHLFHRDVERIVSTVLDESRTPCRTGSAWSCGASGCFQSRFAPPGSGAIRAPASLSPWTRNGHRSSAPARSCASGSTATVIREPFGASHSSPQRIQTRKNAFCAQLFFMFFLLQAVNQNGSSPNGNRRMDARKNPLFVALDTPELGTRSGSPMARALCRRLQGWARISHRHRT